VLSGRRSLGRLTGGSVLAQTRKLGYWPFRLCLEAGIRDGTDKGGNAVFRFSIDGRGRVSYVRRMRSEFSPGVTDCMRKAAYAPRYEPSPPRRVDVELIAQVARGDVPLPRRDPQSGAFDESAIAATLDGFTRAIAECYALGLSRDERLWGRLELRLRLGERGTVSEATELGSRFPDPEVTACAERAVREGALPAARHDDLVVAWRLGEWPPP
jgi:hypothetical protein